MKVIIRKTYEDGEEVIETFPTYESAIERALELNEQEGDECDIDVEVTV